MNDLKLPYLNLTLQSGRLVAPPVELPTSSERKGATFTIATNRYRRGHPATTTFIDCVAWEQPAEFVLGFCGTGSAVLVTGSLTNFERRNGTGPGKRALQVTASQVQLLDRKPADEAEEPPDPAA